MTSLDTQSISAQCIHEQGHDINSDDEDERLSVSCASLKMMPRSVLTFFKLHEHSHSLESVDSGLRKNSLLTSLKYRIGTATQRRFSLTNPRLSTEKEKIRNIYRQPISRLDQRPRSNSCCKLSYYAVDRPHMKKDLKSILWQSHDQLISHKNSDDTMSFPMLSSSSKQKRPSDLPISSVDLKSSSGDIRPRARSMPMVPQMIIKEKSVNIVSKQKPSPLEKRSCFRRDKNELCHRSTDSLLGKQMNDKQNRSDDTFHSVKSKVVPSITGSRNEGKILKVYIKGNSSFQKEHTKVKSVTGGGAFIVQFLQQCAMAGCSETKRITKKVCLDCIIDPYRVKATVRTDGVLTIEAPIIE